MSRIIELSKDDVVSSKYVEGWPFSIFGNPKLSIICGNCNYFFKTRDYYPYKNKTRIVSNCPKCGKWNVLGNLQFNL